MTTKSQLPPSDATQDLYDKGADGPNAEAPVIACPDMAVLATDSGVVHLKGSYCRFIAGVEMHDDGIMLVVPSSKDASEGLLAVKLEPDTARHMAGLLLKAAAKVDCSGTIERMEAARVTYDRLIEEDEALTRRDAFAEAALHLTKAD